MSRFFLAGIFLFFILFLSANESLQAAANIAYEYSNSHLKVVYMKKNNDYYKTVYTYDSNGNVLKKNTTKLEKNVDAPVTTSYSNASYDIVAFGVDPNAIRVSFPTWSENDLQPVWHAGVKLAPGIWKGTVPYSKHEGIGGYMTHIYVDDAFWGASQTTVASTTSVTIPNQASMSKDGYEIILNGVGENTERVAFPTWTERNGQDDIVWNNGTKISPTSWKATISFSEHNYESGNYITHIYTSDRYGNSVAVAGNVVLVEEGVGVQAPQETSSSNPAYEIYAYGIDPSAQTVGFPTWSEHDSHNWWYEGTKVRNGVWKTTVVLRNHADGLGSFNTHIYVDGKYWNASQTQVKSTTVLQAPAQVNLVDDSYKLILTGVGQNVQEVKFPTWTDNNGQDDIVWTNGIKTSSGTWEAIIPFSDHKYEAGSYTTHAYTYDKDGHYIFVAGKVVNVVIGIKAPQQINYSSGSYEVYAYGIDPTATRVRFPTWSEHDTHNTWYEGTKVRDGIWKTTIVLANHNDRLGNFTTHIYVGENAFWGGSVTVVK